MHRLPKKRPLGPIHALVSVAYHVSCLIAGTDRALLPKLLLVLDEVFVVLLLHEIHLNVAFTEAVRWESFVILTCGVIGGQTFMEKWGVQEAMMVVYAAVCLCKFCRRGIDFLKIITGVTFYQLGIVGVASLFRNYFALELGE